MVKFELRYSQLFLDDFDKITNYLINEPKNELSAKTLVADVEAAFKKRLGSPLTAKTYGSISYRPHTYRRIQVGNFLIFYVVISNTTIIRRMLYGRRDLDKIL